jgi:hypothetical protein
VFYSQSQSHSPGTCRCYHFFHATFVCNSNFTWNFHLSLPSIPLAAFQTSCRPDLAHGIIIITGHLTFRQLQAWSVTREASATLSKKADASPALPAASTMSSHLPTTTTTDREATNTLTLTTTVAIPPRVSSKDGSKIVLNTSHSAMD